MANGVVIKYQEGHLVLELPAEQADVEGLPRQRRHIIATTSSSPFTGPCPEQFVHLCASLNNTMGEDLPTGNLDISPPAQDADLFRSNDNDLAEGGYTSITPMAHHLSEKIAGYSLMLVTAHDRTTVSLDDGRLNRRAAALTALAGLPN